MEKTRFEKAYNELLNAYFEGTLAKGNCAACACGNIINDALGLKVTKKDIQDFYLSCRHNYGQTDKSNWSNKRTYFSKEKIIPLYGVEEITNEAGYTIQEFTKIESAFECNTNITGTNYRNYSEQEILEDQYNGLIAVVNVLLELDNMTNNNHKEEFKKHPKLLKTQLV